MVWLANENEDRVCPDATPGVLYRSFRPTLAIINYTYPYYTYWSALFDLPHLRLVYPSWCAISQRMPAFARFC